MSDQHGGIPQEVGQRLVAGVGELLSSLAGPTVVTFRELRSADTLVDLPGPATALTFRLSRKATGPAALVLPGSTGLALARMLLGEDGPGRPETPGPEEEDALRELANQVAGAVTTTLGGVLGATVGFESPAAAWLPGGGRELQTAADAAVLVFSLSVGSVAGEAFLLLSRSALPSLAASPPKANLPPLPEPAPRKNGNGIEMLLDISLPVTVELGRTRMMVRDILHLAPGSILELDKLAGEPVDIMINDKSIARGEVVVIDESFGVRLTSIVTPSERVMNLR